MSEITPELHMRQCIQKVATGPAYSKDLSYDEARDVMRIILEDDADPVQTAILFIALRMKRETDEENRGILQALIDTATISTANVDELVDISDPYDGYTRGVPTSPFMPAVLAALGVNAVSHGLDSVGPKYGSTHYKVLKAAGVDVNLTPEAATKQLETIGWTYIDQSQFAPKLHDLIPLRQRIIKRQVLTTVEVLLGPIRAKNKTHFMSGYVHKAYPPIYASLARHSGFDSAMFVRGVEGGIIPSLQQSGRLFYYHDKGEEKQRDLSPKDINIKAPTRAVTIPDALTTVTEGKDAIASKVDANELSAVSATMGLAALAGEKGLYYDALVYSASICLTHLNRYQTMSDAADAVKRVLDNGDALAKLKAAA
ncbi:MAG: anthranilate phosphoribosyltransferase [Cocleimonas sp.]|nr:anthranilate phosphoribosyltransferase [Cocleimonas sp.]